MFPDIKPLQTHVERLLVDFVKIKRPTITDFMAFRTRAQIGDYLDKYRAQASYMTDEELTNEKHDSGKMKRAGDVCPSPHCDCHDLISGGHKEALLMRFIMAAMLMRIDDPHNGCCLPKAWEDRLYMPNYLRNAVPHCRIHTGNYYLWLGARINIVTIKTPEQLIQVAIRTQKLAKWCCGAAKVMPKTGR